MEVVGHPYLEGVKCREDGAVFLPQSGVKKAHWTFGHRMDDGYMRIRWKYEDFRVHRLICEAFHGTCPPDKTEVDHIDRNPANNKPETSVGAAGQKIRVTAPFMQNAVFRRPGIGQHITGHGFN